MTLNDRIARGNDETAEATAAALGALTKRFDDGNGNGNVPVNTRRTPPPVDQHAELKGRIHRACIAKLGTALYTIGSTDELATLVKDAVAEELAIDRTPLSRAERVRVAAGDRRRHPRLRPARAVPARRSRSPRSWSTAPRTCTSSATARSSARTSTFTDDAHVLRIIDRIVSQVGRRVDESSPMVDARLPDGSRVNAIIPPLSLRGPTLTIRKFSRDPYTLADLASFGALTPAAGTFLAACVRGKVNILISGGTGSGKTTLLNALSGFVPGNERIVTIEDAAELQLQQRHVVSLEARPPNIEGEGEVRIRELVRNALRMRPDRIIVGEVRGPETLDMLQAMNTGHEGSLTTIHANTPRDALHRLEMLVLMGGVDLPLRAVREQIASAFDLIIHLVRLIDGSRRVSRITEVFGLEGDVVTLQDLFVTRSTEDDGERSRQIDACSARSARPACGRTSSTSSRRTASNCRRTPSKRSCVDPRGA